MSLRECALFLSAVAVLSRATLVSTGQWNSWHADRLRGDSCAPEILGGAAAVDTSHLRHVSRPSAPGRSTEGGETTVYYVGRRPRVVVIRYFGETGRATIVYYVLDSARYTVQREAVRYAASIGAQNNPMAVSRLASTLYVCNGGYVDPLGLDDKEGIKKDLDSTLVWARRADH
jgi:hypothetical protein